MSLKFSKHDTLLISSGFNNLILGSIYFTACAKFIFPENGFPNKLSTTKFYMNAKHTISSYSYISLKPRSRSFIDPSLTSDFAV